MTSPENRCACVVNYSTNAHHTYAMRGVIWEVLSEKVSAQFQEIQKASIVFFPLPEF